VKETSSIAGGMIFTAVTAFGDEAGDLVHELEAWASPHFPHRAEYPH